MNTWYRFRVPALLLATLMPIAFAYESADSIRCKGDLIAVGDSEEKLLESCGDPTRREGGRWIYAEGDESFTRIVGVGNGMVVFIRLERK